MDTKDLVSAYIRFANAEEASSEYENNFWAADKLSSMCRRVPTDALEAILSILGCNPGPKVLEILAAGPLESLLVRHGVLIIDEVESRARDNKGFASLLGGVWQSDIDKSVWSRIEKARGRNW